MVSLAVKYRPKKFEDCLGNPSIIKILKKQIEKKDYAHCYLFTGSSGIGKTTIARILANEINDYNGTPIEIDAASNNGVDNIRAIVEDAKLRAFDAMYKVYIIDEAHAITTAGWQAFLKCLEEPPKYTIFMLCTTEPKKIPQTILNRVMRFNLAKVSDNLIEERLKYICEQEGFTDTDGVCSYISKNCDGGVRSAIAMLEKCASLSSTLNVKDAVKLVGSFSPEAMIDLTIAIAENNEQAIINIIEHFYKEGVDLKVFLSQYLDFIYELIKYSLFKCDMTVTKLPSYLEEDVKYLKSVKGDVGFLFNISNEIIPMLSLTLSKSLVILNFLKVSRQ